MFSIDETVTQKQLDKLINNITDDFKIRLSFVATKDNMDSYKKVFRMIIDKNIQLTIRPDVFVNERDTLLIYENIFNAVGSDFLLKRVY